MIKPLTVDFQYSDMTHAKVSAFLCHLFHDPRDTGLRRGYFGQIGFLVGARGGCSAGLESIKDLEIFKYGGRKRHSSADAESLSSF